MSILNRNSVSFCIFVLFCFSPVCLAQGSFRTYTAEGRLISEGNNTSPIGELGATTYRLEMVRLERPFTMGRGKPPLEEVFRLTILTAETLPMERFSVWIGETAQEAIKVGPKAAATILYRRKLDTGLPLRLSVVGKIDLADRPVLPEALYVPPEYATSQQEIEARRPRIKLLRIPNDRAPGGAIIQLEIENVGFGLAWCQSTNHGCDYFIEMDGKRLNTLNTTIWYSLEQFAQLRDGAEIVVKRGRHMGRDLREPQTVLVLGRLNKSSLPPL